MIFNKELTNGYAQILLSGVVGTIVALLLGNFEITPTGRTPFYIALMCVCVVLVISFIGLVLQKEHLRKRDRTLAILLAFCVIVGNVTLESYVTSSRRLLASDIFPRMYEKSANADVADAIDYLKENDTTFYRVVKLFDDFGGYNDSMVQGYYGASSYNSVENHNVLDFINELAPELMVGPASHYYSVNNGDLSEDMLSLLGVKYVLSYDDISSVGVYEQIAKFGDVRVFRYLECNSIARFYTDAVSVNEYKKLREQGKETTLADVLILRLNQELSQRIVTTDETQVSAYISPSKSNLVTAHISSENDGWLFFPIPYENGWQAYIDEKEAEIVQADMGFSAVRIQPGVHTVTMEYHTPTFKLAVIISVIGCLLFACECVAVSRKRNIVK